jgi:pyrroloquinoline quinone biosynthesis protein D
MSISINPAHYPMLAGYVRMEHDTVRERWVLQAPERVLVLDETSKEIVDRCTGKATVGAIIDALSAEYDAPRDVIEHDVKAVLELLSSKTFLVMNDESGTD